MQIPRSITLALALLTATPTVFQAHTEEVIKSSGTNSTNISSSKHFTAFQIAVFFTLFTAAYIRLVSKPTAKSRVNRTWKEYFKETAKLLNITQIFTQEYWERFDKLIIGDQLKVLDKHTESPEGEGTVVYKDKWVKSYPSGMVGYIDSFVLRNLKSLFENIDNLKKCGGYLEGFGWE